MFTHQAGYRAPRDLKAVAFEEVPHLAVIGHTSSLRPIRLRLDDPPSHRRIRDGPGRGCPTTGGVVG